MKITLIEVMIVVAFLAIVGVIAQASYDEGQRQRQRQCIDGEMWDVANGIATPAMQFGEPIRCKVIAEAKE